MTEATNDDGLADRLEAFAYFEEALPPEGVKNAPFKNKSPSDLQFQFFHLLCGASSYLVTFFRARSCNSIYNLIYMATNRKYMFHKISS